MYVCKYLQEWGLLNSKSAADVYGVNVFTLYMTHSGHFSAAPEPRQEVHAERGRSEREALLTVLTIAGVYTEQHCSSTN